MPRFPNKKQFVELNKLYNQWMTTRKYLNEGDTDHKEFIETAFKMKLSHKVIEQLIDSSVSISGLYHRVEFKIPLFVAKDFVRFHTNRYTDATLNKINQGYNQLYVDYIIKYKMWEILDVYHLIVKAMDWDTPDNVLLPVIVEYLNHVPYLKKSKDSVNKCKYTLNWIRQHDGIFDAKSKYTYEEVIALIKLEGHDNSISNNFPF